MWIILKPFQLHTSSPPCILWKGECIATHSYYQLFFNIWSCPHSSTVFSFHLTHNCWHLTTLFTTLPQLALSVLTCGQTLARAASPFFSNHSLQMTRWGCGPYLSLPLRRIEHIAEQQCHSTAIVCHILSHQPPAQHNAMWAFTPQKWSLSLHPWACSRVHDVDTMTDVISLAW